MVHAHNVTLCDYFLKRELYIYSYFKNHMQVTLLNKKKFTTVSTDTIICVKKVYICIYALIQDVLYRIYRISLWKTLKNCLTVVDQKAETGCLMAKGGNLYFLSIYTF